MSKQSKVDRAREVGAEVSICKGGKVALVHADSAEQVEELKSIGFTMNEITWYGSIMSDRLPNGQPDEIME